MLEQKKMRIKSGEYAGTHVSWELLWSDLKTKTVTTPKEYAEAAYKIISNFGDEDEIVRRIEDEVHKEKIIHSRRREALLAAIHKAYELPHDEKLITTSLNNTPSFNSREASFVRNRVWMLTALEEVRKATPKERIGIERLTNTFPEFLRPFDETAFTSANAVLLGIKAYLEDYDLAA